VKVKDSTNTNVLTAYTNDALGRRIIEAPAGATASDGFFSTSGNVIEERRGSTVTSQNMWGLGEPRAFFM
jgi:hypothetical protein